MIPSPSVPKTYSLGENCLKFLAKGRKVATSILARHTVLKAFLIKLGVTEKTADNDACLMEHILSAQTMDRIRDFLGKAPTAPAKPAATKKKAKKETK